jgi:ABC-2 type transport system permease protein
LRRTLLIAKRDYLQIVRTKAYIVGLILLPLLFGGGFLLIPLANRGNARDLRIAVLDRTGVSAAAVIQSAEEANRRALANAPFGSQGAPRYSFEEVKPEPDQDAQLLSLSDRVRNGELFLVLDISPEALRPSGDSKQELVRYYTNSGGIVDQQSFWLPGAVNDGLRRVRLTQAGVDPARVPGVLGDVAVVSMNLVSKDPATGNIVQGHKKNPIQTGAVPFFLVFLLYIIAIFGSAPNLGAVAQDKMQRVYEMLLSSASSFELMMGKVLAAVGASLTSSTVYIIGGLLALAGMAMFGIAPLHLIPWFFV